VAQKRGVHKTFFNKNEGGTELNKNSKKVAKTITGMITPVKWNDDGMVVGVMIQTDKPDCYMVEHNLLGQELIAFVNKKTEASGKIRMRLDGRTLIHIRDYVILDEPSLNVGKCQNINVKISRAPSRPREREDKTIGKG
jgi:hypothetical protein